jgi:hypothetical protein
MAGRHTSRSVQRRKRNTESSEYAAMMMRIIYGYGYRIAEDPAALAHLRDLEAGMRDAVNLGIYAANKLGDRPYSINEIAAMMGISKQAVHKRVQLGEAVYVALETARSHGAVVRLDAMRQTRAMVLGQAGVPDRTGSPRELEAGS